MMIILHTKNEYSWIPIKTSQQYNCIFLVYSVSWGRVMHFIQQMALANHVPCARLCLPLTLSSWSHPPVVQRALESIDCDCDGDANCDCDCDATGSCHVDIESLQPPLSLLVLAARCSPRAFSCSSCSNHPLQAAGAKRFATKVKHGGGCWDWSWSWDWSWDWDRGRDWGWRGSCCLSALFALFKS